LMLLVQICVVFHIELLTMEWSAQIDPSSMDITPLMPIAVRLIPTVIRFTQENLTTLCSGVGVAVCIRTRLSQKLKSQSASPIVKVMTVPDREHRKDATQRWIRPTPTSRSVGISYLEKGGLNVVSIGARIRIKIGTGDSDILPVIGV
jgi:hypothetical protein